MAPVAILANSSSLLKCGTLSFGVLNSCGTLLLGPSGIVYPARQKGREHEGGLMQLQQTAKGSGKCSPAVWCRAGQWLWTNLWYMRGGISVDSSIYGTQRQCCSPILWYPKLILELFSVLPRSPELHLPYTGIHILCSCCPQELLQMAWVPLICPRVHHSAVADDSAPPLWGAHPLTHSLKPVTFRCWVPLPTVIQYVLAKQKGEKVGEESDSLSPLWQRDQEG